MDPPEARLGWLGPPWREAVLVGLVALGCLGAGLGRVPIMGRDEARFAQAAREMRAADEWVVPTFGGEPRYHKPILFYWAARASYAAVGVSAAAARLPSVLAGAALAGLLAGWVRRRLPAGSGLLTGLVLVATPTFHVEARAATADLVMLLPTVAAMLALERVVCGDLRRRWPLLFWSGLGLGVLAKGPVAPAVAVATGVGLWALGRRWPPWQLAAAAALVIAGWWRLGPTVLVVPLAAAAVAAARSREARRTLARLRPGWGLPLAAALVLPWVVAAWLATDGEFLRVALGHHVVARSLVAFESHGGFPGFYLVTAAVAAFPWAALAPRAVASASRRWRTEPELGFRVSWLLGSLVLLEMVRTKLVHYWLPAYPAGVLLVVWLLWRERGSTGGGSVPARALLVAGAVLLAATPVAASLHFGLDFLVGKALAVGAPLVLASLVLAAGRPRRPTAMMVVMSVASLVFLLGLVAVILPPVADLGAGRRAAAAVTSAAPERRVVVYRLRDDELLFELPVGTRVCASPTCLEPLLSDGRSVVLVARPDDLNGLLAVRSDLVVAPIERVRGLDLGHGRWAEVTVSRLYEDGPASPPTRTAGSG